MAHFELQPEKEKLQNLAEEYWLKASEKERELEKAVFEAGEAIRRGEYSLGHLETIVRWKSPRVVPHLCKNNMEDLEAALEVAASANTPTKDALEALIQLHGVAIPVSSAILTAIFLERYTVLDFHALEALGHPQQDMKFYEEYLAFCRRLADSAEIRPQEGLPAPTTLRALDRALWRWSKNGSERPAG
ncbi:MAG: hypothetical protein ABSG62_00705 [Terracidiphilus sp.]|jgi:hypothetical protein